MGYPASQLTLLFIAQAAHLSTDIEDANDQLSSLHDFKLTHYQEFLPALGRRFCYRARNIVYDHNRKRRNGCRILERLREG